MLPSCSLIQVPLGVSLHNLFPISIQRANDAELVLSFAQCVSEISLSMQSKEGRSTTFQLPQKRVLLDLLMVSTICLFYLKYLMLAKGHLKGYFILGLRENYCKEMERSHKSTM